MKSFILTLSLFMCAQEFSQAQITIQGYSGIDTISSGWKAAGGNGDVGTEQFIGIPMGTNLLAPLPSGLTFLGSGGGPNTTVVIPPRTDGLGPPHDGIGVSGGNDETIIVVLPDGAFGVGFYGVEGIENNLSLEYHGANWPDYAQPGYQSLGFGTAKNFDINPFVGDIVSDGTGQPPIHLIVIKGGPVNGIVWLPGNTGPIVLNVCVTRNGAPIQALVTSTKNGQEGWNFDELENGAACRSIDVTGEANSGIHLYTINPQ